MSQVEMNPAPQPVSRTKTIGLRVVILALIAVLGTFIASQGTMLWREYSELRFETQQTQLNTVVGYPGIMPKFSTALKPKDWFHDEGDTTVLWSGWQNGNGHSWFRFQRGELLMTRLSEPMGRDSIRAIDNPLTEQGGGPIWDRIPGEAVVLGLSLGEIDTVYPIVVLNKVLVVNDTVGARPLLVVTSPFNRDEERTAVYDPTLDGHRITLGHSGYFHQGQPLLYDRGTESLWVNNSETLTAIAGKLKGQTLSRVTRLTPTAWANWRSRHPSSRLVVGDDRSRAMPKL